MGRRSRKRASPEAGASRAERDAARARLAGSADRPAAPRRGGERPPAPWGRFPLTELLVLLAIVLGVVGLVSGVETPRGRVLLVAAIVLGSLGGLEIALRDHLAGYRSHTTLLAGACAVGAMIVSGFALAMLAPALPVLVVFAIGALVFAAAFPLLRRAFQRRSGGLSFR